MIKRRSHALTIAGALVIGLIAGSLSFGPISLFAETVQTTAAVPQYKINENGQTYGSGMYAPDSLSLPDLILADGDNGVQGYIKKADINNDLPKNPTEALEWNKKLESAPAYREVPLYDFDGVTVVGSFKIFNPLAEDSKEIVNKLLNNAGVEDVE
ncbi:MULTISPECIES: hypothetical protein [Desulfitobacterium]|uniref:Peptidase M56 BlaR1 n=1 Tax=Desulfitobacterium dehalogenans (strain ATCC 51507 / DSM 9161 / JW/IU-DC1) TaxID=756499 RepID=I4AB99_DESDJ|nr:MULTISPECIES: hypothetical protein [Desulfitobacterium]AFM01234.1 hypothetical protein Desde_2932 [Desulfitobacterium dehalogenans ATCC 51507]